MKPLNENNTHPTDPGEIYIIIKKKYSGFIGESEAFFENPFLLLRSNKFLEYISGNIDNKLSLKDISFINKNINTRITKDRKGGEMMELPITSSREANLIKQINIYPVQTTIADNKGVIAVKNLKNFAENSSQELRTEYNSKVEELLITPTQSVLTSPFFYNNIVFNHVSIDKTGIVINKGMIMPLMSLDGVRMSPMDFTKIRLNNGELRNTTIDYSYSPRTVTMGKDGKIKAQMNEIQLSNDGVDVIYDSQSEENKMEAVKGYMTEVLYQANGFFYSDYLNQNEVSVSASVNNYVYMMGSLEDGMGIGDRILINTYKDTGLARTSELRQVLENSPRYASLSGPFYSAANVEDAKPASSKTDVLGYASLKLSPHEFRYTWKFDEKLDKWKVTLKETKETNGWGALYNPVEFNMLLEDTEVGSTQSEDYGSIDAFENAVIKVDYMTGIPFVAPVSTTEIIQYNIQDKTYNRLVEGWVAEFKIPNIVSLKFGYTPLVDDKFEVKGVAGMGSLHIPILKDHGFEGMGGAAEIEGKKIWGFLLAYTNSGTSLNPLYEFNNGRVGFVYDESAKGFMFMLQASFGIGTPDFLPDAMPSLAKDDSQEAADVAAKVGKNNDELKDLEDPQKIAGRQTAKDQFNDPQFNVEHQRKADNADEATQNYAIKKSEYDKKKAAFDNDPANSGVTQNELNSMEAEANRLNQIKESAETEFNDSEKDYNTRRDANDAALAEEKRINALKTENDKLNNSTAVQKDRVQKANDIKMEEKYRNIKEIQGGNTALRDSLKKSNPQEWKNIPLNSFFLKAAGNWDYNSKSRPININDAELSLTLSDGGKNLVFTGAGEFSINKGSVDTDFSVALLVSANGIRQCNGKACDVRFFIGLPSIYIPKIGTIVDLKGDLQLDIGSGHNTKDYFFFMGGVEGYVPLKVLPGTIGGKLKLAFGDNAPADIDALTSTTRTGGNILSTTAQSLIGFMGSSFNTIAEQSLSQRETLFNALDAEWFGSTNTFSGILMTIAASAELGLRDNFNLSFLQGSYNFSVGMELALGIGVSWKKDANIVDLRFGITPYLVAQARMKKPFSATLIDIKLPISSLCLKAAYYQSSDRWEYAVLWNIFSVERIIGFSARKNPGCWDGGFLWIKPCLFAYYVIDTKNNDSDVKNGEFYFSENRQISPPNNICPVTW